MKNKIKLFVFITLAVIISFIAGCKNLDSDNTETGTETPDSGKLKTLSGTVTVNGTAQAGQTLTANTAGLEGSGTISYQWKRGDTVESVGVNISNATLSNYILSTDDESKFIKVTVTRNGYIDSVTSNAIGPIVSAQAETPTVTSVTVNPETASLLRDATQSFVATVNGENNPPQFVTWSVEGGVAGTDITADGILTIAAKETAKNLTVMAKSTFDDTKSGTAAVTVLHPTVTSVTVSPVTTNVNKGETQQFTATVTGTNGPEQTVTWTVSGGGTGTSINANGLLTVAFGETSSSLTVKATSTVDTDKSGTAAVTVKTPPLTGSVTITGIAHEGNTLTANTDNLNGSGTISYQWKRGDTSANVNSNIGINSATYVVTANDIGKYINATVTRNGYDGNKTSEAVGPVIAAAVPSPTVTSVTVNPTDATVLKGATQAFTATVTGNNNPPQTVTWTVTGGVSGTSIATNGTLTVAANETAATLTVKAASTIDTTKSATATVTVPVLSGTVTISGTTQVGQNLTADTTNLVGSGTISYQWTSSASSSGTFTNISGAASSTYKLVTADQGKYIKVTVTRAGYRNSVTSAATAAITFPALSGSVTISGTTQVGQTLTASTTSLGGSGTINYQWKRGNSLTDTNPTNIGTNSSTYSLVTADEGKYIKVTVTRSENTGSADSNTLGTVTLPALNDTVSITGTAQREQSLTANITQINGGGTTTYQWKRGDTSAAAGTNISGANSSTYSLVSADEGKYISVTITRSGNTGSVTSAAVGPVTQPALSGSVSISGTAQVGQTLTANTSSLGGNGGTISYQWTSSASSSGTFTNISGATSSTYKLLTTDKDKYLKVTVTRTGYTGSVTSSATVQVTQPAEVVNSTNTGTTALNGLTTPVSSYDVVDLPPDNKTNVMKVSPTDKWAIAEYSLSAYKGKEITITLSVNVKRTGKAGTLNWQINNSDYPSVATLSNAATGTWHSMSGTWTGTPSADYPSLYLNNDDKTSSGTTFYIDNFTITIKETSTGGGTGGGSTTITTTPLDKNAAGVQTFTANSNGNKALSGSSYGYEMWTEGGNNNKLIWYGPNQGGGAAFRAEWNNPNDFLGRVGYYWGNGGLFTTYKNIYADFNYTRSGRSTAGNYSYIGIYGWARNPNATKEEEKLIEYYIVEDWFGNSSQSDTSPMGTGTTGGSVVGSYTLDGATYSVIKNVRQNKPSIDGDKTFTQYFSVRQTLRKTGTISITEHFKKWEGMNMKLGNMYECKFLVEAGGGTGWLEFTYLRFSQEDSPR